MNKAPLRLCDTHVHVFDPARFPYTPARRFTPGPATASALLGHLKTTGMSQVVLVQPSVYGTDNRCLLDAMGQLGSRARGVAVVDTQTTLRELAELDAAGVVGARLNMVVNRVDDTGGAAACIQALEALLPSHWHLQLHLSAEALLAVSGLLKRSARRWVVDHLGLPPLALGTQNPAWRRLCDMAASGHLWVKLSGPYLVSAQPAPHPDLQAWVQDLADAAPHRLLWGSNWPHTQGTHRNDQTPTTQVEPFRQVPARGWLSSCKAWLGPTRFAGMHHQAAALYGFNPPAATEGQQPALS